MHSHYVQVLRKSEGSQGKTWQLQPSLLNSSIRWFKDRPLIVFKIFFVVIKIYILAKNVWLIDQFIKHIVYQHQLLQYKRNFLQKKLY